MDTLDTRQTLFIEVLLPLNLANTFTYRIPFELNEEVIVGKRVSVPFGKNKVQAGIIYAIGEKPPAAYQAKYIIDIVDIKERVFPVGRLDKDTTGLILLTNDGRLTNYLIHPRYNHEKEYIVETF